MTAYPSINWWPGNLRPYESTISFLTRFCELNCASLNQCFQFFECQIGYQRLTAADISRIMSLLREDLSLVQTVFSPSVTLDYCGRYNLPQVKANPRSVRYCEECAAQGYHSYLHEANWLSKCPFHMIDLETCSSKRTGTIAGQLMAALKQLMRSSNKVWPYVDAGCFNIHEQGELEHLAAWAKKASTAAIRLSQGQIWHCDLGNFIGETSFEHAIGRLRTFEPMPKLIEPLFTEAGETWHLETRQFPFQAKFELARLKPHLGFELIFDFYKNVSRRSANSPPFVKKYKIALDAIRTRHGICRCNWGRIKEGWYYHWMKVTHDEWPLWPYTCPYNIALQELELGWGRADLVLSSRKAEDERLRFIRLSRLMRDAGLIEYTPDAKISPEGYLYWYPQVWPCCEWINNSPLTELLSTAAEFEIEAAISRLTAWLDDIDDGFEPQLRNDPTNCVRLCETEEGLSLIKWTQPVRDRESRQHRKDSLMHTQNSTKVR